MVRSKFPVCVALAVLIVHPHTTLSNNAPTSAPAIPLGSSLRAQNVEEPFDYFSNSWAVIGLKDYVHGTRITPKGEYVLADDVLCRPLVGKPMRGLNNRIRKKLRGGYLPIVTSEFVLNRTIRYTIESFACPLDPTAPKEFDWPSKNNYLNLVRVSMFNLTGSLAEAYFGLDWRTRDGKPSCAIRDTTTPDIRSILAGDRILALIQWPKDADLSAKDSLVQVRGIVPSQSRRNVVFCIPFQPLPAAAGPTGGLPTEIDFDKWATATTSFWEQLLARGAAVDVPEQKVGATYKASLVYQFIGRDKADIHAGEGFYDDMYLRDGAYQIISLLHAGYIDEARQSLEFFLRFQRDDGRFESQKGQLDANGYAIWALVEYYRLTGDAKWLARVYPQIVKSVQWIQQARRQEKDPDSPFFGVLPNAVADGENLWDGKYHIVGYDWQNLRGLQSAVEAARALGKADDASAFSREFDEYRQCILKAVDRTGLGCIPPSYEKAGTHWGNLEAIFPTVLIDPQDPRLSATLDFVQKQFGAIDANPGGFIEGTIQWSPPGGAIHPYMSQFVTNSRIIRGDCPDALDGFYSFLLHTTSTHGFPEGVYYKRREAWSNTVPHLWAAAMYVTTLRNMLIREQDGDLHLLSCVPPLWLADGRRISIGNAPTHFGRIGVEARAERNRIVLTITPPDRAAPAKMVVHLPDGIEILSAEAAGKPLAVERGRTLILDADVARSGGTVTIHVKRSPAERTATFATRADAYEKSAADLIRPVPGLTDVSAAGVIDPANCLKLDLAKVATTNPLTAPFVGENPGKYIFAKLPLGDQTVRGVPMHIIDPAANNGKAFVVLNGHSRCSVLPQEAEVPVGAQGRYLCVLGSVTGWGSTDPGTGPWNAVAEYEIRYADGSAQTVPLIAGRTADDWASPPIAAEVEVGLRDGLWHLNLLTVELEPKPVKTVVFRDLGTPAAPVVAAMTLIK